MRIGKVTENTLKRSVLKQIRTEFKGVKSAAVGSDCAFSENGEVYSVLSTVTQKVSDPGFYAVMKAAAGLASQGIDLDHVTLSILLPVDSEEKQIRDIVSGAIEAAKTVGTVYAGGHTEVTTSVNRAVVSASAVGFCRGTKKALCRSRGTVGEAIVMTGFAALEGTAMIAGEKRSELIMRYPAPFIEEAAGFKYMLDIRQAAGIAAECGASSVHDISQGGVFAGLWEIAERAGTGLVADLKAIPIRQETIEICEFFELNPYVLISGGALLITTNNPDPMLECLRKKDISCQVIGHLKEENDRIIINEGEERYLELPGADEVHKVL